MEVAIDTQAFEMLVELLLALFEGSTCKERSDVIGRGVFGEPSDAVEQTHDRVRSGKVR